MIEVTIRDQTDADLAAVHALVTAAYRGLPHATGTEPFIMDELWTSGGAVVALVAEDDTGIVGQGAFSAAYIFGKGIGWHALGPLAVRPDRQRQGIGSALIKEGFARLRALGSAGCIVAGDPAYYQRFGFRRVPDLHVPGIPDPYVMALPFDETLPSGAVDFHEAFAATEPVSR